MTRLAVITAALVMLAGVVRAEDDPEAGLFEARLSGTDHGTLPASNPTLRPQLISDHSGTLRVLGGVSLSLGIIAEVSSWALYIARQNKRLAYRDKVLPGDVDGWETLGAWSLWTGVGASGLLVTGEYLLLPEAKGVPTLAWIAGAGGLGLAAVGVGFLAGGSHCAPSATAPGVVFDKACASGTSDSLFGVALLLSSVPLVNIPLVFLLRGALGETESLSVGPGSVQWSGRF
jgi:hypothetical protein